MPSISMNRSFSRPWLICEAVTVPSAPFSKRIDGVAVVVELAARLEDLQVATDRVGQQAGHVAGQVVGVRGDVAEAAGRAALGRIGPPGGLLLVFGFRAACAASLGCRTTRMALISPSSPPRIICRACRTSG